MASAVLLMALGVSEDTARGDYLLSNVYRHDQNEMELDHLRRAIAERQGGDPGEVDVSKIQSVFYLQSPYFDAMLTEIEVRHGSFEGYLEDGGKKRWRFIGAYLIYGQWKQAIVDGLSKLAQAYVVTGDKDYAHRAGVLQRPPGQRDPAGDGEVRGPLDLAPIDRKAHCTT